MKVSSTGTASQSRKEKVPWVAAAGSPAAPPAAPPWSPASTDPAAPPAWSSRCWKWRTSRERATAPRAWWDARSSSLALAAIWSDTRVS